MKQTTKKEKSDRLLRVRSRVAAGKSDAEIAVDLGLAERDVFSLRQLAMKQELDRYAGNTEEAFAGYAIFMAQRIDDLRKLHATLKKSKQGSAAVGAIKAQAELYDRILKRGEELGLITKVGDGSKARNLIGMADEELAAELHGRLMTVRKMRSECAGIHFSEVTYDPPERMPSKRPPKPGEKKKSRPPTKRAGVFRIKRKASLPANHDLG